MILFKETLYQSTAAGKPFVQCLLEQGVYPGIKVDEVRGGPLGSACWMRGGEGGWDGAGAI